MAVVRLAYRFALDPSPAQERALRSHAGAARFAWNWALAKCSQRYATERTWYSAVQLHKPGRYETVAAEDLNVATADRWYPSSKQCSGCGTVKAKLALSERTYQCDACGLVVDRDVNATRNLLNLAASGAESLNAREGTVRPRRARQVPVNLEPGTLHGGKTGTAAPQGTAAA